MSINSPVLVTNGSRAVRALIVGQGVVTVLASLFIFPIGVILVATNVVMAYFSRGVNRKLFVTFAIVGGVICLFIVLFLLPVSSSAIPGPVSTL